MRIAGSLFSVVLVASIAGAQTPVAQVSGPGITTLLTSGNGGRVAWSPQNLIAFDRKGSDGYFQVWTMNLDGSNQKCLTCTNPNLPSRHHGTPDFDPTGKWIVFQVEKADAPLGTQADQAASPGAGFYNDVWVMDSQGTRFYQLTSVPIIPAGGVLHPHFNHKGDKLQWAQRLNGSAEPFGLWALELADFVVDSNGVPSLRNIRQFQPGPLPRFYETHGFTPDDQGIYFSGNPEPAQGNFGYDIYVFNYTTGALTNLTNTPNDWDEHATLAPDGKHILWMSSTNAGATAGALRTDFWLMNLDGSGKRRLTWFNTSGNPEYVTSPVVVASAAWSPDGSQYLAYLITDNFGNAGPDALISLVAPTAHVSAASFKQVPLTSDSIVTVYSRNLSTQAMAASSLPLPTTLNNTTLQITDSAGNQQLAPLFFVSPGQINYAVPSGLAPGQAKVTVTRDSDVVAQGTVTLQTVSPGLFAINANGQGVAAALVDHVQGSQQNVQNIFQCGPSGAGSCTSVPIDLSADDQAILLLYGTGIRGRSTLAGVKVTIGGQNADVLYAGPQGGFVGLDQLNVRVPKSLSGAGEVDIVLAVDGITANTVRVAFK